MGVWIGRFESKSGFGSGGIESVAMGEGERRREGQGCNLKEFGEDDG